MNALRTLRESAKAATEPDRGNDAWTGADRASIHADVAVAARIVAPTWPLETFIAVNPLGDLEQMPFERAIAIAADALGARGTLDEELFRAAAAAGRIEERDLRLAIRRGLSRLGGADGAPAGALPGDVEDILLRDLLEGPTSPPPRRGLLTLAERVDARAAARIDAQTVKWCAAFLDRDTAWPMPRRELGFYPAWRRLVPRDPGLPRGVRRTLRELPEVAEEAVLDALVALGVEPARRQRYLRAHLACLPGWAAHVRWRGERGDGIDLIAYLALRLALEAALLDGATLSDQPPPGGEDVADRPGQDRLPGSVLAKLLDEDRGLLWLDAYESGYRRRLLGALNDSPAADGRPAAQLVCCIDARSEGLRRNLETLGAYETLGFAGFFAVAIRFRDLAGGESSDLCPVLISPQNEVAEQPAAGTEGAARRRLDGLQTLRGVEEGFHDAKQEALSPFVLAEVGGWAAGPLIAARAFVPGPLGEALDRLAGRAAPPAPTEIAVGAGFDLAEAAELAEVALRMMGLVEGFGRLVVLCGHGAHTENNPHEAALACGACGGSSGGPNARTAAAIFNDPEVRRRLAEASGIEIPDDTWFLPAEHDTTSDRVELLDLHLAPASHGGDIERLAADLARAGDANRDERAKSLPGSGAYGRTRDERTRDRGRDWAQVFPEWGLAGNAAFIIAPREVTAGVDLGRRVFLHSYRAEVDPEGLALETIMTAPLIVAQWINHQYYFSTVDPVVFGAGTKTVHNVVAGVGVLAGQTGDLQMGLPWQSVADGERLVHEPMRLLAVIQAPIERIDSIVDRHAVLRDLFGNGWVGLVARESGSDEWLVRERDGRWLAAAEREEG